ncbi:MAG: hypothetical protein QXP06_07875 [Candidatus Bathyarchaeia archaeon]
MTEKPEEEMLPVSEKVKVLRFQTLFKGGRWWDAAGLLRARKPTITLTDYQPKIRQAATNTQHFKHK